VKIEFRHVQGLLRTPRVYLSPCRTGGMFHVFHPGHHQPENVDIIQYCALFGRDRYERAEFMLQDVNQGLKVCQRLPNGTWQVQTQTHPTNQNIMYTVSSRYGRIAMCTCDDFYFNAQIDDSFECKHMLLVDFKINGY
jgi:hypothetical protein